MRAIDERFRSRLADGEGNWLDRVGIGLTTLVARSAYRSKLFNPSPDSPNTVLSRILRPGDIFIDGGANVGQMTRIASVTVGVRGEVHAFEPHPEIYLRLLNTMTSGRFRNVRCNNLALAAKADVMKFYLAANGVSSSLSAEHLSTNELKSEGVTNVNVTTLDIYHDRMRRPVDFVKLDLESYELVALQGAEKLIADVAPLFICESHHAQQSREMITFMYARGYTAISPGKGEIRTPEDYKPGIHLDILFTHPRSRLHDRVRFVA